jgi:hypothetical protein
MAEPEMVAVGVPVLSGEADRVPLMAEPEMVAVDVSPDPVPFGSGAWPRDSWDDARSGVPEPRTAPSVEVSVLPDGVAADAPTVGEEPGHASPARRRAKRATPVPPQPNEHPSSTSRARRPPAPRGIGARQKRGPAIPPFCPYCAIILQPPPETSHRCTQCLHRIVVRRVEGRVVYLTEAAAPVFEAERRRIASSGRWTRERQRWLKLAASVGAPVPRVARLESAQPSQAVVDAARALYIAFVDRSFNVARRERRWEDASLIRREQALALHRIAGSPETPPAELVALLREGAAAELKGIATIARDAELRGADCCDACRADDGRVFAIAVELQAPRLPHAGCPWGLCRCRWDLAAHDRTTVQRYLRRRPRSGSRISRSEAPPSA